MTKKKERLKTKSKNFYDDEIQYILPNGDIYLKEGVKRKNYNDERDPYEIESYINEVEIRFTRQVEIIKERTKEWDDE